MKKSNVIMIALILGIALPMVSLFTPVSATTESSLVNIQTAGVIHVGTNAEYAPFETVDPASSEIVGFDVDIMEFIAADIGVTVEWHDVAWDGILLGLEANSYDVIISAMTITEEREEQCDFTRFYYQSFQSVMVRGSNENITCLEDLNSTSVDIGFQTGTTSDLYSADHLIATPNGFEEVTQAIQALSVGNIDAVLGDKATLADAMKSNPQKFKLVDQFSPENFGIACKSGSTTLVERMDSILNGLLGTDQENPVFNDSYSEMYDEWFMSDAEIESYAGTTNEDPSIPGFSLIALIAIIPVSAIVISKATQNKMKKIE